jgi:LysR family transcriptional regulator, glycine cleavage system transcriptional activator
LIALSQEVTLAGFRKNVPSLNALVALEAAARHKSITLAAAELGVTQAAVSRQISALELELGTQLFVRKHRSIEPTSNCLLLASSLANSFSAISESVDLVRSSNRSETVTIGATLAFSTLWLLPRLTEFRKRFPSVQIRVVSQDSRIQLASGEIDVAIRFGTPPFEDAEVIASKADTIFPVCSPEYAKRLDDTAHFYDLQTDLIANDVSDREWYSWVDWFSRAGIKLPVPKPSLRFNHYADALQAARAGQGIALGWNVLVKNFLDDGSLVRLGELVVTPEGRYNVLVPKRAKRMPIRDVAAEWLANSL